MNFNPSRLTYFEKKDIVIPYHLVIHYVIISLTSSNFVITLNLYVQLNNFHSKLRLLIEILLSRKYINAQSYAVLRISLYILCNKNKNTFN